jgi:HlyD family secretion protein
MRITGVSNPNRRSKLEEAWMDATKRGGKNTQPHRRRFPKVLTATIATVIVAGLVGLWFYRRAEARDAPVYRFATVERGNIETTVSATGALSAVRTVQVGTQVSGQIAQIFVDFNDVVKKGQLLARIDPTLQQQAVRDAQAGLERSNASLAQARREYDRNKQLFDARVLAETELETSTAKLATAEADQKSAHVAVDRAQRNLAYTAIYAPINGVVVERNVDMGQTVAASLSAPQLFLIANDLSRMQILASVDESEIGSIREGGPVRFTVQSYPNDAFSGSVQQVRLQSTTRENVVNYTVVVAVENRDGRLLPGMTATVRFVVDSATNVLIVPNAALRFRPPNATTTVAEARTGDSALGGRTLPASATGARAAGDSVRARRAGRGRGASGTLWYVDSGRTLAGLPVHIGLSDGQRTSVSGPTLDEGMRVIIGIADGNATTSRSATSTNPLQPTMAPPRGPGRF